MGEDLLPSANDSSFQKGQSTYHKGTQFLEHNKRAKPLCFDYMRATNK
jgi:hypothetical protein